MRYALRLIQVLAGVLCVPLIVTAQTANDYERNAIADANRLVTDGPAMPAAPDVKAQAKKPAAKTAAPDQQAMMEAWKKASIPGEMHKKLNDMVGTFDASVRMWMDPTKPPEDSTAVSVNKWVLGDRFVESKYEGTMMGEPFNGLGYTGYDNVQKRYVGTWMDSTTTGIMAELFHKTESPVVEISAEFTGACVLSKANRFACLYPIDYMVWTQTVEGYVDGGTHRAEASHPKAKRELWLTGRVSPRSMEELHKRGWTVHEKGMTVLPVLETEPAPSPTPTPEAEPETTPTGPAAKAD